MEPQETGDAIEWPVESVHHPSRGDGLAASRKIDLGETVLRVAPLVAVPYSSAAAERCATCMGALKGDDGSQRCSGCGVAVLCSRCSAVGARGRVLHSDECAAWASLSKGHHSAEMGLDPPDVRVVLRLLYACRRSEQSSLPADHTAELVKQANMDAIVDGLSSLEDLLAIDSLDLSPGTVKVLIEQAKQAKLLVSAWARAGLDHCVGLFGRVHLNGMEVTEPPRARPAGLPMRGHNRWGQGGTVGVGLYPSAALLNHSCEPNCRLEFGPDGFLTVSATEDVPEGAELTITYIDTRASAAERKAKLNERYGFDCRCTRCLRER